MKSASVFGGILLGIMLLVPWNAKAAILSIFPEREAVDENASVRLEVGIDTEGERVNAVQAVVLIPEFLTVTGVETGGSLIDVWVEEPAFDTTTRMVRLVGGLAGGFAGRGLLGTIVLEASDLGEKDISFDTNSVVLLHDGAGTVAKVILEGTRLKIEEALPLEVSSPTHPESVWSPLINAIVEWPVREGVVYSWTIDINPESIPDTVVEEFPPPLELQGLGDGLHYFHLREGVKGESGEYEWSRTAHLRILVDTTAPRSFEPVEVNNKVVVPARDESAGVERLSYRWKSVGLLGSFGKKEVLSTELIKVPVMLKWFGGELVIRAIDGAGNAREQTMKFAGSQVARIAAGVIGIIVIIMVLVGILKYRRKTVNN